MIGMAHIDAEHIDTRFKQAVDHLTLLRGRPQGGDDFDTATAAHTFLLFGSGVRQHDSSLPVVHPG